jgi:hypothetical protein
LTAALFGIQTGDAGRFLQLRLLQAGQQHLLLGFLPHVLLAQLFARLLGRFALRHKGQHLGILEVVKLPLFLPVQVFKEKLIFWGLHTGN